MNQTLIKFAKKLSAKAPLLRRCFRYGGNIMGAIEYWKNTREILVDSKTIVFSAFYGQNYCCSPKAIYEYMQASSDYADFHYIWIMKNPQKYEELAQRRNTQVVLAGSKEYHRAMAKAKYWVFNYRMADYIRPGEKQTYVQCWHGTPLKRLGYDISTSENAMNTIPEIRDKYRADAKRFDYLISPSPFATDKFNSAWNLMNTGQSAKILEIGYPRNDFLVNYTGLDVQTVKETIGVPKDKKILLYAPTWRDNQHEASVGYIYETKVNFDRLRDELSDEWIILFRAHYIVANAFDFTKYKDFVWDVSMYDDINELYIVSDLLVTDYSSVFFDYANLQRPILFYMYDLEYYGEQLRGFYLNLDELPGPIVKKEEELIQKIRTIDNWFDNTDQLLAFHKKYNPMDDGRASERLVREIIDQ